VAYEHTGFAIRLVAADLIKPLMGGKVIAKHLKSSYSIPNILFTSGYADEAITNH
jgi:hypothetical protein